MRTSSPASMTPMVERLLLPGRPGPEGGHGRCDSVGARAVDPPPGDACRPVADKPQAGLPRGIQLRAPGVPARARISSDLG